MSAGLAQLIPGIDLSHLIGSNWRIGSIGGQHTPSQCRLCLVVTQKAAGWQHAWRETGAPVAEGVDLFPSAHAQRNEHDGAAPHAQDLHHWKLTLAFTDTQSQHRANNPAFSQGLAGSVSLLTDSVTNA